MPTASIGVEFAVELLAAGLADGTDHDRSLGLVRAEVRGHNLQFRCHVGVGVHGLAAVAAGVNDVSPVRSDVESTSAGSVRGETANRTGAGALVLCGIRTLVRHAASKCHAGHNLDELGSVLADNGDILKDALVDERGLLARVGR